MRGTWLGHYFVLERPKVRIDAWQGSLIEDKRDAAGTLYRRNRYLDPQTGRFTQEDPIGLAGGINVYGFAAGDPVNFGDPFGLKVCAKTPGLQQAISDAYQVTIQWDKDGCVDDVSKVSAADGSEGYTELQKRFLRQVSSKARFTVRWAVPGTGSRFRFAQRRGVADYNVLIDQREIGRERFNAVRQGYCTLGIGVHSLHSLVVHELAHGQGMTGWNRFVWGSENAALGQQGLWHAATGDGVEPCYAAEREP